MEKSHIQDRPLQQARTAGPYRLRFVPEGPGEVTLGEIRLSVNDVLQPGSVRRPQESSDVVVLTVSESEARVFVKGHLTGAKTGTVLLRKA